MHKLGIGPGLGKGRHIFRECRKLQYFGLTVDLYSDYF